MLHYPDIQKQIQKEIDDNIELDRLPTLADRPHLPLLDASIMEIQRIGNVVQLLLGRQTPKDITFGGYTIPKEAIIIPNLGSVMTDKELWGDPENFRPERFLEYSQKNNQKPGAFIPFFIGEYLTFMSPFHVFFSLLTIMVSSNTFSFSLSRARARARAHTDRGGHFLSETHEFLSRRVR